MYVLDYNSTAMCSSNCSLVYCICDAQKTALVQVTPERACSICTDVQGGLRNAPRASADSIKHFGARRPPPSPHPLLQVVTITSVHVRMIQLCTHLERVTVLLPYDISHWRYRISCSLSSSTFLLPGREQRRIVASVLTPVFRSVGMRHI